MIFLAFTILFLHVLSLNQEEINFICYYNGFFGMKIGCSEASLACSLNAGIICDVNMSIIGVNFSFCRGSNVIPSSITTLTKLESFSISLLPGCQSSLLVAIPSYIGQCNLTQFSIINCDIISVIPPELFDNKFLSTLDFSGSIFTVSSTIPSQLSSLTYLTYLSFSNNGLSGNFPDIDNLTMLEYLNINSNNLIGNIPDTSNFNSLQYFDIGSNRFIGQISSFNSGNLYYIDLSNNEISSNISQNIFVNTSNQLTVKMNNNRIYGTIPENMLISSMIILDLSVNLFSGTIPSTIINLASQIQELILSQNNLTGSLSTNLNGIIFGNCYKFDLSHNSLSGALPGFGLYNETTGFTYLLLNNNLFNGIIPSYPFGSYSTTTIIDMSSNYLDLDQNSFKNVENNISWLNLNSNNITNLPMNLFAGNTKFASLISLNIGSNFINGFVPSLFRIQYLNLNRNLFVGLSSANFLIDPNFTLRPIFIDLTLNQINDNFDKNFGNHQILSSIFFLKI